VHLLAPKMVLGMGCPHSKDPHSSKAGTGAAPDGSAFRAPDGRLVERLPGGYVRDEVGTEQLSNYAGTLAMINLGRPDSCSSQFVINCDHNRWADAWELESPASHFVFGKLVRRGDLDVAKKAARGATADDDRPADPIKVVRIRMGTAEDAAAKAKAEKEKLLAEAKAGASGRFIYGNWD
jgi:cyclophilin family peptidyl-prolyl cis-trans isomerase